MYRFFVTIVAVALLLPISAFANDILYVNQNQYINNTGFLGYVPDRFIVVLRDGVAVDRKKGAGKSVALSELPGFNALSQKYKVSRLQSQFRGADRLAVSPGRANSKLSRYYKVKFNAGTLNEAMAEYKALPDVERVEPIGIHAVYVIPKDFYYSFQTYHYQEDDHDIDTDDAWNVETGSEDVIVAILDTGTRYYHPDLGGGNASVTNPENSRGNMWINWAEKDGISSVDDDGNGYVDDWIGYDFIESTTFCWSGEDCGTADNDPRDFNGHGTHTAGVVGMISNDGYGMAGTAGGWEDETQPDIGNGVKIMPLRMGYSYNYLGQESGVVLMDAAAEAFYYAANNGAKIASCSWGSSDSGGIAAAIDYFLNNGGMIFVAAGNDGSESADYMNGRGDLISVAAVDSDDQEASFTTYGEWIDICAPGVTIYSTYHDHTDPGVNYWAGLSGTSMATPITAGVASLIWSQNPGWTASQVEGQLYASAENIDLYLAPKYIGKMGAGRVNAYDAVNTLPAPVADFVGNPTAGFEPLVVNFTDQSTGTLNMWSWDFGDGGTSTVQDPSHTYTSPGAYTVSLTVEGMGGIDDETKNEYITVATPPCDSPVANISGTPTSGDYPLTVNFADSSTNTPTSWSWDFGDGGTSTAQNPSHIYTAAGTYSVSLTATNTCGSDSLTATEYITVTTPPCDSPVANISGTPTSGDYPLTVNFADSSTNTPTSWSWDFGDGGTSTAQNPSHIYTAAGTYSVSLTATNTCGGDSFTATDYITVTGPASAGKAYPKSDIAVAGEVTGNYVYVYISDDQYETITETAYIGHPIKTYSYLEHKWEFDLGSGSNSVIFHLEAYRTDNGDNDNFTFAYSTDDITYTTMVTVASADEQDYSFSIPSGASGIVYVRVTDTNRNWGATSLDAVSINEMFFEYDAVPAAPVSDFFASPMTGVSDLTVDFTDASTNTPTSWNWSFGDGGTSTEQNPSHIYATGTYTVSLEVSNAYGSSIEVKDNHITVTDPPSGGVHVANMVVERTKSAPNYMGTCTVTIADESGNPVSGADVYITATGPTDENYNGITGNDGTVYFVTSEIKKPLGEWCFKIIDVRHDLNYDSENNTVTTACESGWE